MPTQVQGIQRKVFELLGLKGGSICLASRAWILLNVHSETVPRENHRFETQSPVSAKDFASKRWSFRI